MRRSHAPSRPLVPAALALALAASGCGKGITSLEDLPAAAAAGPDADAGSWRMIVLSGPSQITVPPPAAVGSDAYRAELAAIKTAQAALSDAQRESIAYWSGGAILRWNQILRELVARYNLPPAPRGDGS